ncbi:MAG: prepilin peptidase [Thermoproteales archaeon]|nr:prepilin peptidase [Thermoproteales archaeon]
MMITLTPLQIKLVRTLIIIGGLSLSVKQDIEKREVDDRIWVFLLIASLPLTVLEYQSKEQWFLPLILHVFSITVGSIVSLLFVYLDYFGGGDAKAFITLSILEPPSPLSLIPSLSLMINSSILTLTIIAWLLAKNLVRIILYNEKFLSDFNTLKEKIFVLLFTDKTKLSRIKEKPYKFFIVERPAANGRRKIVFKHTISEDTLETLNSLLETGLYSPDTEVYTTPAVPYLLFIFLGYILYIILGSPLDLLFKLTVPLKV